MLLFLRWMLVSFMTEFSDNLKAWRNVRRYSQLELAAASDISGRHLSFLETGRSRPSREAVLRLSDALQLPLDARNQLLVQAGFAAEYPNNNWTNADLKPIRHAVDRTLTNHMTYPGLAVDHR